MAPSAAPPWPRRTWRVRPGWSGPSLASAATTTASGTVSSRLPTALAVLALRRHNTGSTDASMPARRLALHAVEVHDASAANRFPDPLDWPGSLTPPGRDRARRLRGRPGGAITSDRASG